MLSKSNSVAVSYIVVAFALVALYAMGMLDGIVKSPCAMASSCCGTDILLFGALLVLAFLAYAMGAQPVLLMSGGTVAAVILLTIHQIPLVRYLTLAGALFSVGLYGMTVARNAVRVLMSIELMLNAVNINMVAFAKFVDPVAVKGQVFAIFILVVAAAEAAVGLAIVLAIYRNRSTVDMEKFNLLKW